MLLRCILATEREADVWNDLVEPDEAHMWFPAPAYYERVAVICRRRKDYVAEIEIIDRWEERATSDRAKASVMGRRLSERKARAIDLMNSR
ncbi:hypothetical protein M3B11_02880 [Brevibacterium sp. p3-SID960]|uniref:hypothetical protein n=1 Tax=Brevibacterium sp. p3-SID960 TaxID=2916063 RepID=UPI0021A40DC4|nr:hypothetical protein [Brevibacterium sp. p3-SID960]MCT1689913.1 hypothetical protein [Brevibacterium sp. p3-SID960]